VNVAAVDPLFRAALRRITLFNDGIGVDIASRWLYGTRFPENLNGTDLTPALLNALPEGTSVFLLGGKPDVVAQAGRALSEQHPNILIVGRQHGYFTPGEAKLVAERISATDAQLVLIGMGHPQQEKWAVDYGLSVSAQMLCVGAFIDRVAGRVPRAPLWMRRLRAEWLYRLMLEPRRLAKRYLWGNLVFLFRIWQQRKALQENGSHVHA
jgi:exopolysaccharide biosynthesis WecB/TagA/CpsF family protein